MLLDVQGLTVRFGGVEAISAVDLQLAAGEVLGLVGATGCGKTTFINALTGIVPIAEGGLTFAGEDITGAPIHDIARHWPHQSVNPSVSGDDREGQRSPRRLQRW